MGMSWEDFEEMKGERHPSDPRGPADGDASSSATNRRAREVGEAFEDVIESENEVIEADGRASVVKIPTPRRRVSRPDLEGRLSEAQAVCVRKQAITVDYLGVIRGGAHVAFEAKTQSTDDPSFSFSRLEEHQRETLAETAEMGGVAFVYVQDRSTVPFDRYVLPVDPGEVDGRPGIIAGVDDSDRYTQSIKWREASTFKVDPGSTWLDKLEDLGRAHT